MSGFLRRLFGRDYGPPPPPDEADQPSIPGRSIFETHYSDSKQQRAIITSDKSGTFLIHFQFWDTSAWNAGHGAFWVGSGSGIYTDSIEIARRLAREQLGAKSSKSPEAA